MTVKNDGKTGRFFAAYAVFAFFTVVLIIRACYGFCQSDESFYAATAGRFAAGDLIFVDEWHPTQLSSLVSMPFFKLYTLITGGTEGIILYFRVLYVLLTSFEAVITYQIVSGRTGAGPASKRRYPDIPAFTLGLFLLLYCHLNMPTLSYYTLAYNFFIFACILCYGGIGRKEGGSAAWFTAGGAVFALSVLSLPSLVVAAVLFMLILSFVCVKTVSLRRPLILFVAGVLIPLALFLIYVYASGNSIAGLLANLSYIMSDEEHDRGYVESFKVFFRAISDVFGRIYYLSIVLVILAMLSYVNQRAQRLITPYILYTDLLLFIYYVVLASKYTGFINTAFALFVFPLFFLTKRKDWYIFLAMFMGGLVFSMTCAFSSYCDLYVLAVGHGIAAAGGIILLWDQIMELLRPEDAEALSNITEGEGAKADEKRENPVVKMTGNALVRRIAACGMIFSMAALIIVTLILRFTNVYRDDRIERLNARITAGPAAGMYTSPEHKTLYDSVLSSIMDYTSDNNENAIQAKKSGRVLFSKLLPWGYLAAYNMRAAAPDTWRNTIASTRLMEYYDSHEMPDVVFVLNTEVGAYEASGDVEADPLVNLNEFSGPFADILKNQYDEQMERDCTVYIRRAE